MFKSGPQSLGQCAQSYSYTSSVCRLQKPAQDIHCREIEAGNGTEVQYQASRTRSAAQGLPEMLGEGAHAAEKEVAAQLVCLHPLSLLQQDGAIGDGAGLVALALVRGELRFDWVHAAEAHGEEHEGGQHPDAHALDQSEGQDRNKNQQNDAVLRPREPLAAFHETFV